MDSKKTCGGRGGAPLVVVLHVPNVKVTTPSFSGAAPDVTCCASIFHSAPSTPISALVFAAPPGPCLPLQLVVEESQDLSSHKDMGWFL